MHRIHMRPLPALLLMVLAVGWPAAQETATTTTLETGTAAARFGMTFEPVEFTPPEVRRATLDNGVTLYYQPEREIPLVTLVVALRAGAVNDPAGKAGVAGLTAEVIRNGGTTRMSGDDLDEALAARGADLSATADQEMTWFRLSVLAEDAEWGIGLLRELLAEPALPEEKLEETRGRLLVALRQRLDQPMSVAGALFPQLVYGRGNSWGATETERTVGAIGAEDLRAFHERHYTSGNMRLAVIGDIEWDVTRALAEESFGELAKREKPEITLPGVEPIGDSRVIIVPRETTQNVLYIGHEGVDRFSAHKFPIKVFNSILSGGFTSRLFKEIRSSRGLAYSVYGRLGEGTEAGVFFTSAMTKVETAGEALELMLGINRELTQEAPKADETELAVQSEVNSFVFYFDTSEQVVRQQITLDEFGYPEDYLTTYVERLKAVTPEDVRKAAAANLHLERIVVLVVGQVDGELREQLAKIGPITEISEEELRAEWL